jgi:hypothetical protein
MAAKLRPRVILPRVVSSTAAARLKPAAVSFSGLLGGVRRYGTVACGSASKDRIGRHTEQARLMGSLASLDNCTGDSSPVAV